MRSLTDFNNSQMFYDASTSISTYHLSFILTKNYLTFTQTEVMLSITVFSNISRDNLKIILWLKNYS